MSGSVEIQPYDPRWPHEFDVEREQLRAVLGSTALRVDHHGSTSVPGLDAKPVIDIQVSVTALEPMETYSEGLRALGYTHHPHPDDSFAPFFCRPSDWPHTHHVHVVVAGGEEERKTLAFRDYLRDHADVAREYAALKISLAPRFSATDFASREAYADAKGEFIRQTTEEALSSGYPAPTSRKPHED